MQMANQSQLLARSLRTTYTVTPFTACSKLPTRQALVVRAAPDDKDANPFLNKDAAAPSGSAPTTSDRRVESLEAAIRGKRSNTATKQRQIPIRGVTQPAEKVSEEFAPWKEGQLFPEGWDRMPLNQKLSELYMGQRGFLFWTNKLAYGAAISMLVGWVFFRFVGPNLGLYQLAGDLVKPQF